ncbi:glycosyltransferase [Shinella yambaruensis]|uniref:glycosyltransferase n=1 Tax=Shinella yambaruensis TaxID=415996 RepID=UPI001FD56BFF|nr:glycosyltransferase [Shinella yambaruensis]MCJ8029550.1 glycosyltransferase [Shinella yambaruensis]MCU7983738.1 glycosyltransferase [Shinella yambaruensis]
MAEKYLGDDRIFDSLVSAAESLGILGRPESAIEILKNAALTRSSAEVFKNIISKARLVHDIDSVDAAARALRKIHGEAGDAEALLALERLVAASPRQEMRSRLPRVAGIMDEFTTASYAPECIYLPLNPRTACQQIKNFRPDFVFVESAWHGNDGAWTRMVSTVSDELRQMLEWCRSHGVPTVFWNKEDPVHYHSFLDTASLCDLVFTTDIDCVPSYKDALKHDNVYFLPFAAQPLFHNPLATLERKDAFNFAGSYYLRYPQRQRDLATILDTVGGFKPVEIYDRNHGREHPDYKFPDRYQPLILGKLPFSEIDKAYKGYRYGINMNTIKQSQTMFARRVYELMASNTVVVSNFSRGVRTMFGDLVLCSDNRGQLATALEALTGDDTHYRKFRLLGLRKVMQEHSYAARMSYILSKVRRSPVQPDDASVALFAAAHDADAVARLAAASRAQSHRDHRLYLLAPGGAPELTGPQISAHDSLESLVADVLRNKDGFAFFGLLHDRDHYGANYLTDLVLSRRYSTSDAVGKGCHFDLRDGEPRLCQEEQRYGFVQALPMRAALVRSRHLTAEAIREMLDAPETAAISDPGLRLLAVDEFNYCRDGAGDGQAEAMAADLDIAFQGIELDTFYSIAESLKPASRRMRSSARAGLTIHDMASKLTGTAQLKVAVEGDELRVVSRLARDKHAYLWMREFYNRETLDLFEQSMIHFQMESDTQGASLACEYYTNGREKLGHTMLKAGGSHALAIPVECTRLRFGFRVAGPGTLRIGGMSFGADRAISPVVAGPSDMLVLTKQYPSYEDLYRYGFLHSRVRAYRQNGVGVDVFRLNPGIEKSYDEFENIDVASGDEALLDATLATGRYRHVLVHLLDHGMWRVLAKYLDRVKVTIWIHGAEIQAWQRRAFEFPHMNPKDIEQQKRRAASYLALWREAFQTESANLHFVFVSETLRREATDDVGIAPPPERTSIIHNYIDGDIFRYDPKDSEHRKKIVSIRSYSSLKYANDLTTQTILELSKRPFFKELTFHLAGDGALFKETNAPLRMFDNVILHQGFLNHTEIAALQKSNGVFLNPTRWDSQGVSRDEAMASGLVPVTSAVAAVPEFVDESCGLLAPAEDHLGLAAAIEKLYYSPDLFARLSRGAAERVRNQSGFEQTIAREIALIKRR